MRQLGRLGVWYPVDRLDGAGIRRLLRTVEDLGYSTFWYPEAVGYESLSIASFMLANTTRLIIGSSIANIYARDPFTARRGLRTLSSLYDDRFILGLGVSHAPMVEGCAATSTTSLCRRCAAISTASMRIRRTPTEWPLVIAALGPLMLKLAAERTAGAVPYNVTPEHTREARAAFGPDKLLVVEQKVCLETDAAAARGLARQRAASLYDLDQLSQQLAAHRLHGSRPRRWRFGQVHRCDGAPGRCGDDHARPEGASRRRRQSGLHSAGPRGGRHGSARPNPERARRCWRGSTRRFPAGDRRSGARSRPTREVRGNAAHHRLTGRTKGSGRFAYGAAARAQTAPAPRFLAASMTSSRCSRAGCRIAPSSPTPDPVANRQI